MFFSKFFSGLFGSRNQRYLRTANAMRMASHSMT
jgi:hypothetical protein